MISNGVVRQGGDWRLRTSNWVEQVYHQRVHTETGMTPLARFLAAGPPVPTPAGLLTKAFRWGEWRTVTSTATVSLPVQPAGHRRPGPTGCQPEQAAGTARIEVDEAGHPRIAAPPAGLLEQPADPAHPGLVHAEQAHPRSGRAEHVGARSISAWFADHQDTENSRATSATDRGPRETARSAAGAAAACRRRRPSWSVTSVKVRRGHST